MKGRKNGGRMESPASGDKDWEADTRDKPKNYGAANEVTEEADEKKRGGRAKRKYGGALKEVGAIKGGAPSKHAGRMPRKAGGRAGSNMNPLSSAAAGTPAKGHTASGAKA